MSNHTVPVIMTGIDVLMLIAGSERGMTISEIVEATGNSRSTVYRIINTFELRGWLLNRNRSGVYSIGSDLRLFSKNLAGSDLHEHIRTAATPIMQVASIETGETLKLSAPHGNDALVIGVETGRSERALVSQLGILTPLTVGASARVLLSGMSQERVLAVSSDVSEPENFLARVDQVRDRGWDVDEGEFNLDTGAYAAPIRDAQGTIVAAVSIIYLRSKHPQFGEKYRRAIISAAESINENVNTADTMIYRGQNVKSQARKSP